jgi:ribonucleotide monophosphatase NagD (HAD superfamily)
VTPAHRPFLLLSESAKEEFQTTEANDSSSSLPFDSVIVGLAPSAFTYENLNTAFRILIGEHEGQGRHREQSSHPKRTPPLIATHKAKFVGAPDGALSLGPGPFVAALENASGVSAEVVGKPTISFFEAVLRSFQLDEGGEGRIAVVGDDVEADLGGGAVELGLWRVLGV